MTSMQRLRLLPGLSLSLMAFGAQAQDEPTMDIIPDPAADRAAAVTQDIPFPEQAFNDGVAEEAAADGLATAQENAADAAAEGLATAMDAVAGAREELGRANMPEGLPDQVPEDLPAVPEDTPPDVPDVPAPPIGG